MRYQLPKALLDETFGHLRACGAGCRECQALWVSPWTSPQRLTAVVHPRHSASAIGFQVDDEWLNGFWRQLADDGLGVRFQIHTHPGAAYHSSTDDAYALRPVYRQLHVSQIQTAIASRELLFGRVKRRRSTKRPI